MSTKVQPKKFRKVRMYFYRHGRNNVSATDMPGVAATLHRPGGEPHIRSRDRRPGLPLSQEPGTNKERPKMTVTPKPGHWYETRCGDVVAYTGPNRRSGNVRYPHTVGGMSYTPDGRYMANPSAPSSTHVNDLTKDLGTSDPRLKKRAVPITPTPGHWYETRYGDVVSYTGPRDGYLAEEYPHFVGGRPYSPDGYFIGPQSPNRDDLMKDLGTKEVVR